ncbi:putative ABC transporter ATP-binding protein [bioreactor metagenome]|uniref:Putative ABC transporter ATP-binding protein n=1 Tax=bioreactor metagenome TaxID=1076179 RepID=A0A644TLX3_9ZZZZ|nr:thiol reductant ABC exporter subunit CydC [Negativicutes bacterium]
MIRLLKLIVTVWPAMLAGVLLSVVTIFSNIGLMGVSAFLIATAALHPPIAAISTAVVGVRFFGIARAAFRYSERYLSHDATFKLLSRLRVQFFQAIEPLAPAGLGLYRPGDLLSRMAADVDSLQFFYLRVVAPPFVAVLTLAGMVYWLSVYSGKFGLVLLAGFIAAGVILPVLVKQVAGRVAEEVGQAQGQLTALVVDSVEGAAELTVFGCSHDQIQKVCTAGEKLSILQKRSAQAAALADSLGSFIGHFSAWVVLVLAVPMVRSGVISGVDLAVLVLIVESSFEAVQPLAMVYVNMRESYQAAGRLFSVIDTKPAISEAGSTSLPIDYDIEFNQVGFAYDEQTKVLDDVSFKVGAGRRVAIVGESGVGKSSIVSLLVRFWDYQIGSITIGERQLQDFQPDHLRSLLGVVPQAAYLFNASIKDNILLANPDGSLEKFNQAVEAAALTAVIADLPAGLETMVGENGRSLSGGQRQRVAIARALLKDAPILVLDEPTAGLDPVTERAVMADIKMAMVGRTTILVTHRLVGLDGFDEILMLHEGKVAERGSLVELINRKGLFFKMWNQQKSMLE